MAKQLDSFPASRKGHPGKYPWDQWFDGTPWLLTQGEDFHGGVLGMKATITNAALRRGLNVRISIDPRVGTIAVQAAGSR